jgi:hypothetical protein
MERPVLGIGLRNTELISLVSKTVQEEEEDV